MRKIISAAALLLISISSFADIVTEQQAKNVAQTFLGTSNVSYVWNGHDNQEYGNFNPAFYVYTGNGKWAIIAADDCATPILMHGIGQFNPESLPENMISLLGDVEFNINEARNQELAQAPEIKAKWEAATGRIQTATAKASEKLVSNDSGSGTALWNQGTPYNAECPVVAQKTSYAGCVATAMAIIMRFYKWPETGRGIAPGYTTGTHSIIINDLNLNGYKYDWDNFPQTDVNDWGKNYQKNKTELAKLLYHCGVIVQMDYSPNGSGAQSGKVPQAMATYMSYSAAARQLNRNAYSNQQWFNIIKAEIDANHPVLYSGQNILKNSGHAFVCDGYNSDNQVHINWGWSGSCNAWFAVCYLGPVSGEGSAIYSRDDSAIFGLVPDGKTEPYDNIPKLAVCGSYPGGITLTSGTIAKGQNFTISISSIWNIGNAPYSGQIKARLYDKSGNLKQDDLSEIININSLEETYLFRNVSFNCKLTEDVALGDYISIVYESESAGGWDIIMPHWSDAESVTRFSAIDITLIDAPSTFNAGELYYPSLVLGYKKPTNIIWYLDNNELTDEYIKMTQGKHTFKVALSYSDGSSETVTRNVTVNSTTN